MKAEKLQDAIGEVRDDYIQQADLAFAGKKKDWRRWAAVAACFALVLSTGVFHLRQTNQGQDNPGGGPGQSTSLVVNLVQADSMTAADYDCVITDYNKLSENAWKAVLDEFRTHAGVGYEEFTAKIPEHWELNGFCSYSTKDETKQYRIHDYVFEYEMQGGGTAVVALGPFEAPLRDCYFVCENPKQSEVNEIPLTVYSGDGFYMAQFACNGVNYDIEVRDAALEDMQVLLLGLTAD